MLEVVVRQGCVSKLPPFFSPAFRCKIALFQESLLKLKINFNEIILPLTCFVNEEKLPEARQPRELI
ncbi:MAG: hypothetical protein HY645_00155 [Acidobacteria bacterium]|nr:hypothetical protein [Acidobacteriota bacterium]